MRLSILVGKPVETVYVTYQKNQKKGWGAIAKELGIKPGSKEFHQLKNGGALVLEGSKKKNDVRVKVSKESPKKEDKTKHSHKGGKGKKK